jgi:hypothetical protein
MMCLLPLNSSLGPSLPPVCKDVLLDDGHWGQIRTVQHLDRK